MRIAQLVIVSGIALNSASVTASNPVSEHCCSIGIPRPPVFDDRHTRCVVFQISDSECGAIIGDSLNCYVGTINKDEDSKFAFVKLNSPLINPRVPIVAASDLTKTFAIWNSTKSGSWRSFLLNGSDLSPSVEFKIDQQTDIKSSTSHAGGTIALIQNRWNKSLVASQLLFLKGGKPVVSPIDSLPLGAFALTMRANQVAVAVKASKGAKVQAFTNEDLEDLSKRKVDDRELSLDYLPEEIALLSNDRLSAVYKSGRSKITIEVFTLGRDKLDAATEVEAIEVLAYSASLKTEKLAVVIERQVGKYALLTFEIKSTKLVLDSTKEFEPRDFESFSDFTIAWAGDQPIVGWRNFSPVD